MKKAIITGSTKGIGFQCGKDLLDLGYFVYFNGHNKKSIEDLKQKLSGYSNYEILDRDMSTIESNIELAAHFRLKDIYFDVIICNLGITDRTPFGKVEIKKWNEVFECNLSAPFFLIQNIYQNINQDGKIIFISSIAGQKLESVSISYGVSKAAINMLVPYLAKEFASKNITVNAIAPGYILTTWHDGKDKAQLKRIAKKSLIQRLGTTKEISDTIKFIINNNYLNGQIISVNGGFNL